MENQHRQIKGYRELNQAEIDLMNEIKEEGKRLQTLLDKVRLHNQDENTDGDAVRNSEAGRWAAIAKTDLQTGLMALTRAVAKPAFF